MKRVSVLIPTCNRPDLLRICIRSCLDQTRLPDELVIGDDSTGEQTRELIESYVSTESVNIIYARNTPPLGQGLNIDAMFKMASGDYFCLIHDDDYLEPEALERLLPAFQDETVVIAFGKQKIISNEGGYDQESTEKLNIHYRRTPERAGLQPSLFDSAAVQQIPNNGYVVKAEMARTTGYRASSELFDDACDAGFAILLAENNPEMKAFFLDDYTAVYRQSTHSVARSKTDNNAAANVFRYIYSHSSHGKPSQEVEDWLRKMAPIAIGCATGLGQLREAREWTLSRYYRSQVLTLGGLGRLFRLLKASVRQTWQPLREQRGSLPLLEGTDGS